MWDIPPPPLLYLDAVSNGILHGDRNSLGWKLPGMKVLFCWSLLKYSYIAGVDWHAECIDDFTLTMCTQ